MELGRWQYEAMQVAGAIFFVYLAVGKWREGNTATAVFLVALFATTVVVSGWRLWRRWNGRPL